MDFSISKARSARINADSLEIKNALIEAVHRTPAGGVFHSVETDVVNRNSFALRLDADGPIFTVTVSYGGGIRNSTARRS